MKHIYTLLLTLLLILSATSPVYGSRSGNDSLRMEQVRLKLDAAAKADRAYLKEVDISIGKIALPEMLRNIANVSDVNLSVKGAGDISVSCNFSRAKITDLLYFLCGEYGLDVEVIGNIVSVFPLDIPSLAVREPEVVYDTVSGRISYELNNDRLDDVAKKITSLTGVNIVVPHNLNERKVSGFLRNMNIDGSIPMLAVANGLEAVKNESGVWSVGESEAAKKVFSVFTRRSSFAADELSVDSLGLVTARIGRGNTEDLVRELCDRQGFNYFFISPVQHETSVFLREVEFDTFLDVIFAGTKYTYYNDDGIYIFGENVNGSNLTSVEVVALTNRAVAKVEEAIPASLKANVGVYTFPDLNSVIVSGEQKQVSRVSNFIRSIDKRVPMITIEVMIVDVTDTDVMEAGISFGIGQEASPATSGTLSPGLGMNISSQSINSLLGSFNGFSSINLGKVSSQFYLSLKFLEDKGKLSLRSTPKLSTLNGHQATLTSGQTRHYKEITNNYIGYQNPTLTENYIWKSIDANMTVKITPYVSLDRTITLDIEIEQTEFTAQEDPEAPPGTATRSFKSLIKVQNEEVVLLGGIDRNTSEKSSSGLPWIARVPVLKWLFGKSKNNSVDQKLSVFIKPTVTE